MGSSERMSAAEYRQRLADGTLERSPRRPAPPRTYPESQFQRDSKKLIDLRLRPGAIPFHVPNERANPAQRMLQAAFGVLPGVSDWVILYDGRAWCLELKTPSGQQSEAQRNFQSLCQATAIPYRVATDLEQVEQALSDWGLIR